MESRKKQRPNEDAVTLEGNGREYHDEGKNFLWRGTAKTKRWCQTHGEKTHNLSDKQQQRRRSAAALGKVQKLRGKRARLNKTQKKSTHVTRGREKKDKNGKGQAESIEAVRLRV